MFWKKVERIRKGTSGNKEKVKIADDTMVVEKEAVKVRQAQYFEKLLNVEEDREAKIVALGRENWVKVLGGLSNAYIMEEEA